MSDELIDRLRQKLAESASRFPPVSAKVVTAEESRIGFALPPLLKRCYSEIANGGFGPGYGIIGLQGGAESDFGSIVETYQQIKADQESLGNSWESGTLPFCDFGCNIFMCVHCNRDEHVVSKFEDSRMWPQAYNVDRFLELWLGGADVLFLSYKGTKETVETMNPFTGKKTKVSRRTNG